MDEIGIYFPISGWESFCKSDKLQSDRRRSLQRYWAQRIPSCFCRGYLSYIGRIVFKRYFCPNSLAQVSELGDKTFFIAAILAMRDNKVRNKSKKSRACKLMKNVLPAHSLPCGHRSPGSHDCPLCTAGVRGDDLHPAGVHILRLHRYHVPLWLVTTPPPVTLSCLKIIKY